MGYGFKATGVDANGDDTFQIDSEQTSTRFYATTGNALIAAGESITGFQGTDAVFGQPVHSSSEIKGSLNAIINGSTATFKYQANYALQKPMATGLANNTLDDYGLLVYDTNDVVVFDSRKFSKGIEVKKVVGRQTMEGGKLVQNFTPANSMIYGPLTSGNLDNIYVSLGEGYYAGNWALSEFYYDADGTYDPGGSSRPAIYYQGWFYNRWDSPPSYVKFPNLGEIIVGELKT